MPFLYVANLTALVKWRVGAMLAAGVVGAILIVWSIGPNLIFAGIVRAGFGGIGLLCGYALVMLGVLAGAWKCLLPHAYQARLRVFFLARLVRDSVSDITPLSPIAGMFAAARLATLGGMDAGYAIASVAADATAEAMAQVAFLVLGVSLGASHLQRYAGAGFSVAAATLVIALAVPCIAGMIVLQRNGAGWAEKIIKRRFPKARVGNRLHQSIHELYGSRLRLAGAASLHLLGWIVAGVGTFVAFRMVGGRIGILDALALESLVSIVRSLAVVVPAGIGVQEAGYAVLAPMFGLPMELGLTVSLLRRTREIVLGVPALIYWQVVESRRVMLLGNSAS